jgi:hypothetical protein
MSIDPDFKDKIKAELSQRMTKTLRDYAEEHGLSEEEVMQRARDLLGVNPST